MIPPAANPGKDDIMSEQRISEQDPPNGRTALYAESLSRLIRLETVSGPGTSGSKKFHAFRELLKDMFPTLFSHTEYTEFTDGFVLCWKGRVKQNPAKHEKEIQI